MFSLNFNSKESLKAIKEINWNSREESLKTIKEIRLKYGNGENLIENWHEFYDGVLTQVALWDIDQAQPIYQTLVKSKEIKPGRVLDIGCGRGKNAMMFAVNNYEVTGIDLVEAAISDAKAKAIERHVKVNFVVGNVLQ